MKPTIFILALLLFSINAYGATVADSLYQVALALPDSLPIDTRIEAFERVVKSDRKYAPALHQLARLYLKKNTVNSRQRAERAIRQALRFDSDDQDYQLTQGEILWAKGFRFNSSKQYREMLKKNPENARAAYWIGVNAVKQYLKYLDMFDYEKLDKTVVRFEWAHFAEEDRIQALMHFNISIDVDPDFAQAYYQLALIHYENNDAKSMLAICKKLLDHHPDDKNAWLYNGLAYQRLQAQGQAYACYTTALKYMLPEERVVMESVYYLIDEKDRSSVASVQPDSAMLTVWKNEEIRDQFWRQYDPLHTTPYNERQMEHYGRVAYANLRFGRPEKGIEGWQTDMGRFYIRYGRWLSKQDQRPEINELSLTPHTESWFYEGFHITFQNWDGLDNWRFENSRNYKQNYETTSDKEFTRQNESRYVDPYRRKKYSLPHLVTTFRQDDSIRIEVAYALPKDKLQISDPDNRVQMNTGLFLYTDDWQTAKCEIDSVTLKIPQTALQTERRTYALHQQIVHATPGNYHLIAEMIDLGSQSIGTFDTRRNFAFPDTGLTVSDLLLASQIRPKVAFPESRADLDIQPNPLRTYSRTQPIFVYFEVYNLTRNDFGRTHYDISYRLGLPNKKDIDPAFFDAQDLPQGELVISPRFDESGATNYDVQYKLPERNQLAQAASRIRNTGNRIETTVSSEYEGDQSNDFTFLEIDINQLPIAIYELTVTITDQLANTKIERHALFRVIE